MCILEIEIGYYEAPFVLCAVTVAKLVLVLTFKSIPLRCKLFNHYKRPRFALFIDDT